MQLDERKLSVSLILMVLLLGTAAIYLRSSLTFFASDTGLRFLQIRALIENGWQSFAIPYSARFLDPHLDHVPYYFAYLLLDQQLFLKISPYLPLVTSFLYAFFGPAALPTIPVLGGVTTAFATYKLGKLAHVRHPYLLLWLTILATPVLFYSLTLWDHTLGTACALIAAFAVARGLQNKRWMSFFLGGLVVAIGAGQRVEIHAFALALLVSLLLLNWRIWAHWGAFVLGGIAGTIPVWLTQYLWIGHPLGAVLAPRVVDYGVPGGYPVTFYNDITVTRPFAFIRLLLYLEAANLLLFVAALLVLIGTFLLVLMLRVPHWRKRKLAMVLVLVILAGYTLYAAGAWDGPLPGLISTFPPLAFSLAFSNPRQETEPGHLPYRFVYLTALLFLGLMLILWPAYGGRQWGSRYLLPAYPLFLVLAFYTYTRWQTADWESFAPTVRYLFVALLVAGVALQLLSVHRLFDEHAGQISAKEAISALPADLILTNHPFVPAYMSGLVQKNFMYVKDENEIRHLIRRIHANGIERFALLSLERVPLQVPAVDDVTVKRTAPLIYEIE